jgi:uncharacterized protein (DUF2249 family)
VSETLTGQVPAGEAPATDGGCGCGGCGCGGGAGGAVREERAQGVVLEQGVAATDLDVRGLAPERRHALVTAAVDALVPGEAVVLANDHDPARLRHVLAARYPGQLTWQYLAEGPALWRVMIGREACC